MFNHSIERIADIHVIIMDLQVTLKTWFIFYMSSQQTMVSLTMAWILEDCKMPGRADGSAVVAQNKAIFRIQV